MMDELWSVRECAEYLGSKSLGSARKTLSYLGVKAAEYARNERGRPEARYDPGEVMAAQVARPGRGKHRI